MKKNSKAPTMKDVALEAGVALGTVSKVFNGIPVGDEYRQKVESAASRLGYQLNSYARGLRSNKTNTIALIIPYISHPFFSSFADYCCELLHKRGYRMMVATTSYDPQMEQECINMVQQNKVDGIIAITYNPNLKVSEDLPFIIIDRKLDANVPCISSDNFSGGQLAARKLVENGCKRLLFLGNSSHVPGEADKRLLGFESYCIQNRISHEIFHTYDENSSTIFDYVRENINENSFPFDGIFCNTDLLACEVLDLLSTHKINVPQDVQLIGFDGIKKLGGNNYLCSTIRQPLFEIAETAVNLLLSENSNSLPSLVCLPVTYCYGGTTKQ